MMIDFKIIVASVMLLGGVQAIAAPLPPARAFASASAFTSRAQGEYDDELSNGAVVSASAYAGSLSDTGSADAVANAGFDNGSAVAFASRVGSGDYFLSQSFSYVELFFTVSGSGNFGLINIEGNTSGDINGFTAWALFSGNSGYLSPLYPVVYGDVDHQFFGADEGDFSKSITVNLGNVYRFLVYSQSPADVDGGGNVGIMSRIAAKLYVADGGHSIQFSENAPLSAVPEPNNWAMLIMGMALVGTMARRRGNSVYVLNKRETAS